jgi:release factor glutamine methyltransferase
MTVLETIKRSTEFFGGKGIESARLQSELLVSHALGLSRMQLYLQFERPLVPAEIDRIRENVRRRGRREPLQHIIGAVEFLGLRLKSDRRALIPRPETELLVETAIALAGPAPARALDLGTGSGAIALALAAAWPATEVTAVDSSPDALDLARENAVATGLAGRVSFVRSDGFDALPEGARFGLIVANPPYLSARSGSMSRQRRWARPGEAGPTWMRFLPLRRGFWKPGGCSPWRPASATTASWCGWRRNAGSRGPSPDAT